MPKTLLAVDDSATMRKVLEITFVGEDFNVITTADRGGLLAKLSENPNAVVIDTTLSGDDGYAICKEVRQRAPRSAIILLASRYTPYDAGRGKDAGADDYIDKPFDTQQLIEKVKKAIGTREAGAPAQAAAPPPPPPPPPAPPPPQPVMSPSPQPMPRLSGDASPPAPPVQQRPPYQPGPAPQRSGTLMFAVDGPAVPPAPGAAPAPPMPLKPPTPPQAPVVAKPAAPAPAMVAVAASTNGLAPKLAQLGLTPAQIDGVLALSREVVEQVVWEVVPHLAEALIKEEIARLTKE